MELLIIVVFVLGYAAIAMEHTIKIDKAASALITGVLCWTFYVMTGADPHHVEEGLLHHISEISNILFFLMGAMTIVELVDAHEGFSVITDRIKTTKIVRLLWILCTLTFFFSALLDNLTTSIVMISLLRKLIKDKEMRWFFAGMVVISANAGGAWSPIGDVTTTMLWIKGQLPDVPDMVVRLIIPSLVAMIAPLLFLTFKLKGGQVERPKIVEGPEHYLNPTTQFERNFIFILGVCGLLFVPIFKTLTHLQPFMGMMLSLGVIWVVTEIMHKSKNREVKHDLSVIGVLRKIDTASVLFFLGILLAVSGLQEVGHLNIVAEWLNDQVGNIFAINVAIGFLSSIVDNVPLVAAAQGMYQIADPAVLAAGSFQEAFVPNGTFWLFLAYCAGVGGSSLIIGSAAGVAVMGLERIDFFWYLKRISGLAVIGYLAGALVFYVMYV